MNYINNIDIKNNDCIFELRNVQLATANAIRRVIISDIKTIIIDRKSIKFKSNNTIFDNQYIEKRLTLIPFLYNSFDNYNLDDLKLTLSAKNNSDTSISIYANQLVITDSNDTILNINDFIGDYGKILLLKLKPIQYDNIYDDDNENVPIIQEINFSAKFIENNSRNGGSQFCPTSCSAYHFKRDKKAIDKAINDRKIKNEKKIKQFILKSGDRHYLKNKNNEPDTIIFKIESIGSLSPDKIVEYSLNILIDKLNKLNDILTNYEDNSYLNIQNSVVNFYAFDYIFIDENDTLGNLLVSHLNQNENVKYAGYIIPHPLQKIMIVRMATNKNEKDKNYNIEVMNNIINNIFKIINSIKKEWTEKRNQ